MQEEEIVDLARCGHPAATEFLMTRFRPLVENKAKAYFLMGADREDVIQEGMIGLYKAIRDFNEDKLTSFKGFAELCITRQIITAIKTATRQKHGPLNSYISLDKPLYDEESNYTLMDMIPGDQIANPEAVLIHQEKVEDRELKIAETLSELERKALTLYMDGHSYAEISKELNTHVKSIDNALQRIKRKLGRDVESRQAIS